MQGLRKFNFYWQALRTLEFTRIVLRPTPSSSPAPWAVPTNLLQWNCGLSASSQIYWIRNSGCGTQQSGLKSLPGDSDEYRFENLWLTQDFIHCLQQIRKCVISMMILFVLGAVLSNLIFHLILSTPMYTQFHPHKYQFISSKEYSFFLSQVLLFQVMATHCLGLSLSIYPLS